MQHQRITNTGVKWRRSGTVLDIAVLWANPVSVFALLLLPASVMPTNLIQNCLSKFLFSATPVWFPSKQARGSLLLLSVHLSCLQVGLICCHCSLFTHLIIMEYPALTGLYLSCGYKGSKLGTPIPSKKEEKFKFFMLLWLALAELNTFSHLQIEFQQLLVT